MGNREVLLERYKKRFALTCKANNIEYSDLFFGFIYDRIIVLNDKINYKNLSEAKKKQNPLPGIQIREYYNQFKSICGFKKFKRIEIEDSSGNTIMIDNPLVISEINSQLSRQRFLQEIAFDPKDPKIWVDFDNPLEKVPGRQDVEVYIRDIILQLFNWFALGIDSLENILLSNSDKRDYRLPKPVFIDCRVTKKSRIAGVIHTILEDFECQYQVDKSSLSRRIKTHTELHESRAKRVNFCYEKTDLNFLTILNFDNPLYEIDNRFFKII